MTRRGALRRALTLVSIELLSICCCFAIYHWWESDRFQHLLTFQSLASKVRPLSSFQKLYFAELPLISALRWRGRHQTTCWTHSGCRRIFGGLCSSWENYGLGRHNFRGRPLRYWQMARSFWPIEPNIVAASRHCWHSWWICSGWTWISFPATYRSGSESDAEEFLRLGPSCCRSHHSYPSFLPWNYQSTHHPSSYTDFQLFWPFTKL